MMKHAACLVTSLACAASATAQLVEVNIALNKPTSGDVAFGAPTSRGNDGIDGTTAPGNWTHADYPTSAVPYPGEIDLAPNPYWQVDFGEAFDLVRIELVDRVGCCDPNRLEGSTITLFDSLGAAVGDPIEIIGYGPDSTPLNATMSFDNDGAGWTGVAAARIDGLDTNQYFQFSEFRAISMQTPPPPGPTNVALGAPVAASGPTWGGQGPANVTDGNLGSQSHPLGEFGTLGFTYTVDLQGSFNLEEIVLWNRTGCCPDRLSNYRVSVHPDDGSGAPGAAVWSADIRTDGSNSGDGGSDSLTPELDPTGNFAGRFIVVENLSDAAYNPQIAELQAFTFDEVPEPPTNYALGGAVGFFAMDGTPVAAWGSLPEGNATDGLIGTVTHPLDQVSGGYYFEIDLGAEVPVGTVEVAGRTDGCCPERLEDATLELLDAALSVLSSQVMGGQVTAAQTFEFPGAPAVRYLRIHNTNGADYGPQIGEVMVFGPTAPPAPFAITAVSAAPSTGSVSITFNSIPGASYAVFGATSPEEALWEEIDDAVPSQGTETTYEFTDFNGAGEPLRLYRVMRN